VSQKVHLLSRVLIAQIIGAPMEHRLEITGVCDHFRFASLDHPSASSNPLFSGIYLFGASGIKPHLRNGLNQAVAAADAGDGSWADRPHLESERGPVVPSAPVAAESGRLKASHD